MDEILNTMEDIKQNIKDNEYKTIMDGLMKLNNNIELGENDINVKKIYELQKLFQWLNTIIEFTNECVDNINRNKLKKYIITKYYDDRYYANIDFINYALKIYFSKKQKTSPSCFKYARIKSNISDFYDDD